MPVNKELLIRALRRVEKEDRNGLWYQLSYKEEEEEDQ